MNIIRTITTKAVAGKVDFDKLYASENKQLSLAKIYGIASKATPDQSDLGAFIRFKGRFRGVNFETGETYEAGSMILPTTAQDMLAGILESVEGSVEFAFEIGVHYDASAVTKYVFDIKPLFEASSDDPLERLSRKVQVAALENKKDGVAKTETVEAKTETKATK